jgi:hypothetical protein
MRSIEFHDSCLGAVTLSAGDALLELAPGYVHQWEKRAGRWRGTGWTKPVRIRVTGASLASVLPSLPVGIADGTLTIGATVHSNLVPLPFQGNGATRLRLLLVNSPALEVDGAGIVIWATGDGRHIEELPEEWAPSHH